MSLKDRILKAVEKQGDPWEPYTGQYGGEGWINTVTGEVRYQDEKPEAEGDTEGEPDQYGPAYDAEGEGVMHDGFPEDDLEDDYGPVDWSLVDEGDPVIVDEDDLLPASAEVLGESEDSALVEFDDGGKAEVPKEDVLGAPAQPPPGGFAEGWKNAPDDIEDLEEGQLTEVYDVENGEYFAVEPDFVGEESMDATVAEAPEGSDISEGDYVNISDDGDIAITATEDFDHVPEPLGDPIPDHKAISQMSEGDEVYVNTHDMKPNEVVEGEVVYDGSDHQYKVETEDGRVLDDLDLNSDEVDVWEQGIEFTPADEYTTAFEGVTDKDGMEFLDGHEVQMEHPALGEVQGEAEISEDPKGNEWLTVQALPEEGEEVEIDDGAGGTVEGTLTEIDGDYGTIEIETESGFGESEHTIPVSDLPKEDASLSLDPQSPLYYEDFLGEVEDPTEEVEDPIEDLKNGDIVTINGSAHTVENVKDGDVLVEGAGWMPAENLDGSQAILQEPLNPPAEAPGTNWEEMPDGASHGLGQGDWVYYHDPETMEMEVGRVDETPEQETVITEDGEHVERYQMEGHVSSLPDNAVDPRSMEEGAIVEWVDSNGREEKGVITNAKTHGDPYIKVMDEDGNTQTIRPNESRYAITDYEEDAGSFGAKEPAIRVEDGEVVEERPTEEVVEDISEAIDFSNTDIEGRLEKAVDLAKEEKKKIKNKLYEHFGVNNVETFEDMKDAWKSQSGHRSQAETLERAFREAFDVSAQHRDNGGRAPTPEEVKMAETVGQLSRDYFDEVFGGSRELYRGASDTAFESFFEQFMSDPNRSTYELEFLTMNNHTTDKQHTADDWGEFTVAHTVKSDDVLSMTDYLFETGYEQENEIGVKGDGQAAHIENIYPGSTGERRHSLAEDIEDWDDETMASFWTSVANSDVRFQTLSGGQLETLKSLYEEAYQKGVPGIVPKHVDNTMEEANQVLQSAGMEPELQMGNDEWTTEDFEGLGDVTNYEVGEGVPVEFWSNDQHNTLTGEVMGVEDGELMIWDDHGAEHTVDPQNLTFVDDVDLESLQNEAGLPEGSELVGQFETDPQSLDPLDEVLFTFSANSDAKEGKVLDVDPEQEQVEISNQSTGMTEYFDFDEVQEGYVVPEDEYESGPTADMSDVGADPDEYETQEIKPGEQEHLQEGDLVLYEGASGSYSVKEIEDVQTDEFGMTTFADGETTATENLIGQEIITDEGGGAGEPEGPDIPEVGETVTVETGYDDEPVEVEVSEVHEDDGFIEVESTEDSEYSEYTVGAGDIVDGPDESEDVGGSLDFEEGEKVHLETNYPEHHPDYMEETGELGEPEEIGGSTYFPVYDENGTIINEYSAQELSQIAEPVEPAPDEDDVTGISEVEMNGHQVNEGDTVTIEDEFVGDEFEAEIREITDDGEVIAEFGEDGPGDSGQTVELTSEPDWDVQDVQEPAPKPEDIDSTELDLLEEFEMQTPDGETKEFEVVETSADPAYPPEIQSEDGERYLLWDDGEMEEI